MGVTGEVFKDVLWLLNGFPYTDDPLVFIELFLEVLVFPFNIYFILSDGLCDEVDELPAKDHRKGFLVEEVVLFALYPASSL